MKKPKTHAEFIEQVYRHPAMKGLRPPKAPPKGARRADGMPRMVAAQRKDPKIRACVDGVRKLVKHHQNMNAAVARHLRGKPVFEKRLDALQRDGERLEAVLQHTLAQACRVVASRKSIDRHAVALGSLGPDVHVFANPAFLTRDERAVFKHLGVDRATLIQMFEQAYLPNQRGILRLLRSGQVTAAIADLGRKADALPYPETPDAFAKAGLLAVRGGGPVVAAVVVAVQLITIAIIVAPFNPELATLLVAVAVYVVKEAIVKVVKNPIGTVIGTVFGLEPAPSTPQTPTQTVQTYGYALGNMSRSKLELHVPNCPFLHLISNRNLRRLASLAEGRQLGLDNCHYCVGGSLR